MTDTIERRVTLETAVNDTENEKKLITETNGTVE